MSSKSHDDSGARERVAEAVKQTLADSYALYQKTHLYHWNVRGPRFSGLHTLFETQYRELWTALDEMAERLRALGVFAPTHAELGARTRLPADNDPAPAEDAMLAALAEGHGIVAASARAAVAVAEAEGDPASADLMTQRSAISEKAVWMLRAHLSQD